MTDSPTMRRSAATPSPLADDTDVDALAFTPVPRPIKRRDGWTADRQIGFIAALSVIGSVGAAARHVGMTARTAYRLRDAPGAESFAAAWDLAHDVGIDNARSTAIERTIDGLGVPVWYKGKVVGERRVYNDRLLFAVLQSIGRQVF